MSNEKFKIGKLSGKGLIIAVGACILAVGTAGLYSYNKISDKLNAEIISGNRDVLSADNSNDEAPVNAEKTDISKKETTASVQEEPPVESAAVTTDAEKNTPAVQHQAMVRPINGEVINTFSNGELVKSKTLNVWKTHDGVDIAATLDEQVKSMTSGNVTKVYEDPLWGACVIIDHGNGLEGYYCNLNKDISIAEGQKVSAGTIIGKVGNTAESEISEAPHLHFAVKKNGEWIDPIALISGEGS